MADRFVDFETKICADWLNMVDDAVVDALGSPTTPEQARQNIGAVEEAPQDSTPYVRVNASWQSASAALTHNALGGRDAADAHPQGAVTGLVQRLLDIESKNASQDTAIADRVTTATFNGFVSTQDARDDAQDAVIAAKADKTYVDSQNAAQDAVIATKASITYVDQQNAVQDANTLALIVALG